MQKQKQTYLIIGGVVAVVVIAVLVWWLSRGKSEPEPETEVAEVVEVKKKRITAPQNVLPLSERPVVSLKPFSKDGGRFVSIEISQVRVPAQTAEYEIVYNIVGTSAVSATGAKIPTPEGEAEGGLQAFMGELSLNSLPTRTENRFGTCSAGGACINNNVDFGYITLNFDAEQKYGVNSSWTYFEKGVASSASFDQAFTLTADELAGASDYLLLEMMGLPDGLTGEVVTVADDGKDGGIKPVAYQLRLSKQLSATTGQVTFANDEGSQLAIYDGQAWKVQSLSEPVAVADGYIYALVK